MLTSPGNSAECQLRTAWWVPALCGPEGVGDQRARHAWIDAAEYAVATAAASDQPPPTESWQQAIAVPLQPFLAAARGRLVAAAGQCLATGDGDPEPIADMFCAVLERQLAHIAARTVMSELSAARASDRLAGSDARQRFGSFLRQLSAPAGLVALFEKYPVLARMLGTASLHATEAAIELLTRFTADRAAVVETLLDGTAAGPIVAVQPGLGDRHQRGRSVAALTFADGRQVIYKPRDLQSYVWFGTVVDWLNDRLPGVGLRMANVVARPGYGWLEYVAGRPLTRPDGAELFYRREGLLLAALHATQATDMHYENVIADDDHPVLVDVETLFQPTLPARLAGADPAAESLADSVYRTALLPSAVVGRAGVSDQSGMGGDPGELGPEPVLDWDPPATDQAQLIWRAVLLSGARNRPYRDGKPLEPADYEAAVIEGFRLGYNAILRERPAFTRLVETGADIEVRLVVRRTGEYARLLAESTQPGLLTDARTRQEALEAALMASAVPPADRLRAHQLADLWAGDIPFMTSRPAESDIWTSAGHRIGDVLDRTGRRRALDTIAAMGETDRSDQEWVISASLATRRPTAGHRGTRSSSDALLPVAAEPDRLLATACGLADVIMARGKTNRDATGQGRVNWLGIQFLDDARWLVLPMGAALADGYTGVALFLSQLAVLTGIRRYAEGAWRAVSPLPRLLGRLAGRSDLLGAIGCGGINGLGGISYGLARMATLLDDDQLREWTQTAVRVTASATGLPGPAGWAAGSAGCLAAMMAVQTELGSAGAAAAVADACAERLAGLVERTDGSCQADGDPLPPGFANGAAGIGWALIRFGVAQQERRYLRAGRCAILSAGEPAAQASGERSFGWCSGVAGMLIARSGLADDFGAAGLHSAIGVLRRRPVLRDLSLCHGELGITEALTVLAAGGEAETAHQARRHRAGLILGGIRRPGQYCGTPGGLSTPGLLNGLAGIGYGLLRLGFPDRVPSVLLLEATPSPSPLPRPAGPCAN